MNNQEKFYTFISQGKIEKVNAFIQEFPDAVNFTDVNGVSAVLYSYYVQEQAIANLLIHQGARIGLFEASASSKIESLQNILQQNPDSVNDYSKDGFQAIGYACFFGNTETVRILVDAGAEINSASKNSFKVLPIHSAVANQNIETARYLLQKGALVNAFQEGRNTALHSAAENGQFEMVELLLSAGANPTAKNRDGFTPLDFAQKRNEISIIDILRKKSHKFNSSSGNPSK